MLIIIVIIVMDMLVMCLESKKLQNTTTLEMIKFTFMVTSYSRES